MIRDDAPRAQAGAACRLRRFDPEVLDASPSAAIGRTMRTEAAPALAWSNVTIGSDSYKTRRCPARYNVLAPSANGGDITA